VSIPQTAFVAAPQAASAGGLADLKRRRAGKSGRQKMLPASQHPRLRRCGISIPLRTSLTIRWHILGRPGTP